MCAHHFMSYGRERGLCNAPTFGVTSQTCALCTESILSPFAFTVFSICGPISRRGRNVSAFIYLWLRLVRVFATHLIEELSLCLLLPLSLPLSAEEWAFVAHAIVHCHQTAQQRACHPPSFSGVEFASNWWPDRQQSTQQEGGERSEWVSFASCGTGQIREVAFCARQLQWWRRRLFLSSGKAPSKSLPSMCAESNFGRFWDSWTRASLASSGAQEHSSWVPVNCYFELYTWRNALSRCFIAQDHLPVYWPAH